MYAAGEKMKNKDLGRKKGKKKKGEKCVYTSGKFCNIFV